MRRSTTVLGIAVLAGTAAIPLAWVGRRLAAPPDTVARPGPEADSGSGVEATGPIRFDDVTDRLRVGFVHVSGNSPEKHFPAANGSGAALADLDADGRMDFYLLTARPLPFRPGSPGPTNQFYRNRDPEEPEEVAGPAGLDFSLFCHGVATGDLDNDGFTDLVLTTYGGTQIVRSQGDGTFRRAEGFSDNRWGSSAAIADFDGDGAADVYVTHYGIWSIETNQFCGDQNRQIRTFCSPKRVPPAVHALYRNRGDWGFDDVARIAGIARDDGRGQGVVAADIDLDGSTDLYVANDLCPNFLFLNNRDGTFRDLTDLSGAGFNRDGMTQAGMGVDAADANRDGLPDLLVTNFSQEYNALYVNLDSGTFIDKSHSVGLAGDSMEDVGWGTRLVDLDSDGWLDVFVTNGHVDDNVAELHPNGSYAQPPKVWRNRSGRFQLVSASAGGYFRRRHVGRGAAFGDIDSDGRPDIVVNHVDSRAVVLRNTSPVDPDHPRPWLRFVLVGRASNRDAVGARVTLSGPGLPGRVTEQRRGGSSYLSAHDPRILIGLGPVDGVAEAEIRWPSGRLTKLQDLRPGQELLLFEPDPPADAGVRVLNPQDREPSTEISAHAPEGV